jgi:hypothetical protein
MNTNHNAYDLAHEHYTPDTGPVEAYTQEEAAEYARRFKEIYGKSFMDDIEEQLERIFADEPKGGNQ